MLIVRPRKETGRVHPWTQRTHPMCKTKGKPQGASLERVHIRDPFLHVDNDKHSRRTVSICGATPFFFCIMLPADNSRLPFIFIRPFLDARQPATTVGMPHAKRRRQAGVEEDDPYLRFESTCLHNRSRYIWSKGSSFFLSLVLRNLLLWRSDNPKSFLQRSLSCGNHSYRFHGRFCFYPSSHPYMIHHFVHVL